MPPQSGTISDVTPLSEKISIKRTLVVSLANCIRAQTVPVDKDVRADCHVIGRDGNEATLDARLLSCVSKRVTF